MSMLAEGRKKVKYSINPRGTTWSNDEDKFGQKLMEKFGWQKGKGLGVNEDGRVEHVKASGKNNTKGFGFKRTDSNNWICHQDDFNSLLSELNANHGRSDQDDPEKVISLEEKSKAAKKRVHYHKHAKGKDLSQRSSEDLDCIFGRKKSKQSQVKEPSPDVQDKNVATPTEETNHGIQTIQSNQSVQEYFAMKMAKLKVKKNSDGQQSCLSDALPKKEMEPDRCAEGLVSNETSVADSEAVGGDEENMEKRKKKKKKIKEKEREKEDKDDHYCSTSRTEEKGKTDDDNDDNSGENCDEKNLSKKMKKSKRKKRSKECIDDEVEETSQNVVKDVISVAEDAEMSTGEINSINKSSKKKLNKKNKVKISPSDSNAVEGSKSLENSAFFEKDHTDSTDTDLVDMDSRISKKVRSSINKEATIVENETMSKPKKNKKRKKNVIGENDVDKSVTFDMENSNSNNSNVDDNNDEEASPPNKKKKSSKKSKSEESLDTQTADGSIGDETKVHVEEIDSAEAKPSSVMNSPQVPKDKYDVKRSMDAINTATKKFQKVGANIDTISGYGYTKQ